MPKPPENTLHTALDALIQIERGLLPKSEQFKALQLAIWAYMEGANAVSTTELIKQGTILKKASMHNAEAIETALSVFKYKEQHRTSENKAIQNVDLIPAERTRRTHMSRAKKQANMNEVKAKRLSAAIAVAKEVLQKKP